MQHRILIVDDNQIDRQILYKILRDDYAIWEAHNGREALRMLEESSDEIRAVLLDIIMPEMDGYGVLRAIRGNPRLARLPVIAVTGSQEADAEIHALSSGANDFVTKPYNPDVIRRRLQNVICMTESAAMVSASLRDGLTGFYNRGAFFEKAGEMIREKAPGYYILSCFDVNRFKVINDQYGTEKGDEVLRCIAQILRNGFEPIGGICSRIAGDKFAILFPEAMLSEAFAEEIHGRLTRLDGSIQPLSFSVGRYVVEDPSLPVSAMYDRATLARSLVKGRFDVRIATYEPSMREHILWEQAITGDMKGALEQGEFQVWYQPQFNHASGALIGAEALVRWQHPKKGLIQPGEFIPVFERNGFIYELDLFVWETVCRRLHGWLSEGAAPLPISVNVSRFDLFQQDLAGVLSRLTGKYDVPVHLLRLEITESAFSYSTDQIIDTVETLINTGFTVEIDDFGSGYSSLNTLKDVPADILKLDMRFLEQGRNAVKGGNILESVVRMAKWLGMAVIAEGVETIEQAEFLKSIGCCYVQGYLYARPMPEQDYDSFFRMSTKEEKLAALETVIDLDSNAFWDPKSMETLIFNSYVGGACIFEYWNERCELLRFNDKYASEFGLENGRERSFAMLDPDRYLDTENLKIARDNILRAMETGDESTCEICMRGDGLSGGRTYLRATVRCIAKAGDRRLFYSAITNVTLEKESRQKELAAYAQLETVTNDIPGGFVRIRIRPDDTLAPEYFNSGFCTMMGMTVEEALATYGHDPFNGVHPEDLPLVRTVAQTMLATGEARSSRYRLRSHSGRYIPVMIFGRVTKNASGERFMNLYYTDVSQLIRAEEQQAELLDNLPCGAGLYAFDGRKLSVIHMNEQYMKFVGRSVSDNAGDVALSSMHPEDRVVFTGELKTAILEKRNLACDLRIRREGGGYCMFHLSGRIIEQRKGTYTIYATYTPI